MSELVYNLGHKYRFETNVIWQDDFYLMIYGMWLYEKVILINGETFVYSSS